MKYFLYSCLLFILFSPVGFVNAQTSCSIVLPEDENIYGNIPTFMSDPIADCSNPFSLTLELPMPYKLEVGNTEYGTGATITTPNGELSLPLQVTGDPEYTSFGLYLFRHNGTQLEYIYQDSLEMPEPTEEEVREYAERYFDTQIAVELYIEIYFAENQYVYFEDEDGEDILDEETGEEVQDRFYDFADFIYQERLIYPEPIGPGEYTLVFDEFMIILTEKSWMQHLREFFVSTAYAQYYFPPRRFAITFTLQEEEAEGASSVLFLPGIQASRLYTEGLLGNEDRVWEPNVNNDVEALAMTFAGESINDIYTRDVLSEVYGTFDVYNTFLDLLEDLKENEKIIKEYKSFAYDWRFDVTDIAYNGTQYGNEIKSLVSEIERLAESSYTDKVTIIGHSNGGILGKALITELVEQDKAHLVDKLVMIGTPQLGTPKAIASMIHGLDQLAVFGYVIEDNTARDVMRNMPGAYGLLPSKEYFEKVPGDLLSTDNSNTTASVRAYGGVTTQEQLNNFLLDTQNVRPDVVPIYEPSTLNSNLLQQSLITKDYLDTWLPPEGIEIYEVVGTGNPTIKGYTYQQFPCSVGIAEQCNTGVYMKAVPQVTDKGDETVIALSASGQDGSKVTAHIDLPKEITFLSPFTKVHSNITESPTVQNFVTSIIKYPYLAETLVVPEYTSITRKYKIIGVHSPVSILLTDNNGKQVGIVNGELKDEIVGSQYFELGDSKYVVVPDDSEFKVTIDGEATGIYSLTIDEVEGDEQTSVHRYLGASSTESMRATFTFEDSIFSNIDTDYNGDGTIDVKETLDGEVIPFPIVYSYALLKTSIKALKLPRLHEALLVIQADLAQHWDSQKPRKALFQKLENGALDTLKATLKLYKKKKLITNEQLVNLETIINNLKN